LRKRFSAWVSYAPPPSVGCYDLFTGELNLGFNAVRRHVQRKVERVDTLAKFKCPVDQRFHVDLDAQSQPH
jgi:hypothetical protein